VGPAGPGVATGVGNVGGEVGIDCVGGTSDGGPAGVYGSMLVAPPSDTLSVNALPSQ
jgi:hypothetical protein